MRLDVAVRIVLAGVLAAILSTVVMIAVLVTGQPLEINDRSVAALAGWGSYASAIATFLLVLIAVIAGLQARREFRTGHRPVPTLGGGRFLSEGVEILVGNVGPGAVVNLRLRLWVTFASLTSPEPSQVAAGIEQAVRLVETGPALFEASLGAIASGGSRVEMLRYGPRARLYDPEWASGWGVIMWDAEAEDLFGETYPGSGYILTEGETLRGTA